ncbi:MAG: GTPase HflX, partial [Pseudomonadota bacterium]
MQKVVIVHPYIKSKSAKLKLEHQFKEICSLAESCEMQVVDVAIAPLAKPNHGTYIGRGKIAELKTLISEHGVKQIIVNTSLTSIQNRNLNQALCCEVIDRMTLILHIFAMRASSKEGQLQVELARLKYQRSRLARAWTHLERQRGGTSSTGGPGERQIEIDRRLIDDKICKLEQDLSKVAKRRQLHRKNRKNAIVALVGYTNAGKSTLFNLLTNSKVMAEDKLFATLDPTIRLANVDKDFSVLFV